MLFRRVWSKDVLIWSLVIGINCQLVSIRTNCPLVSMGTNCQLVSIRTNCPLVSMGTNCQLVSIRTNCPLVSMGTNCQLVSMGTHCSTFHVLSSWNQLPIGFNWDQLPIGFNWDQLPIGFNGDQWGPIVPLSMYFPVETNCQLVSIGTSCQLVSIGKKWEPIANWFQWGKWEPIANWFQLGQIANCFNGEQLVPIANWFQWGTNGTNCQLVSIGTHCSTFHVLSSWNQLAIGPSSCQLVFNGDLQWEFSMGIQLDFRPGSALQCLLNLYSCIIHYESFKLSKLLGGGGQNDMFATPIFSLVGRLLPCPPPRPPDRRFCSWPILYINFRCLFESLKTRKARTTRPSRTTARHWFDTSRRNRPKKSRFECHTVKTKVLK